MSTYLPLHMTFSDVRKVYLVTNLVIYIVIASYRNVPLSENQDILFKIIINMFYVLFHCNKSKPLTCNHRY